VYLAAHLLVAAILIGVISAIQWLLKGFGDPKLYDWIPCRYIFDTMDGAILLVFLGFGIKDAVEAFREE
jgi:hypothetical protein